MNESTNMSLLIEMGFWISSQWVSQATTLKMKIRLPLNLSAKKMSLSLYIFSPLCCSVVLPLSLSFSLSWNDRRQSLCLCLYVQQAQEYWFDILSTCLFGLHISDSCRCSLERLSIWEIALALIPFQILLKWASCLAYHTLNCLIISADPCCVFSTWARGERKKAGLTEYFWAVSLWFCSSPVFVLRFSLISN